MTMTVKTSVPKVQFPNIFKEDIKLSTISHYHVYHHGLTVVTYNATIRQDMVNQFICNFETFLLPAFKTVLITILLYILRLLLQST